MLSGIPGSKTITEESHSLLNTPLPVPFIFKHYLQTNIIWHEASSAVQCLLSNYQAPLVHLILISLSWNTRPVAVFCVYVFVWGVCLCVLYVYSQNQPLVSFIQWAVALTGQKLTN